MAKNVPKNKKHAEQEVTLSLLENERAGDRARTQRIARHGHPHLAPNQRPGDRRREASQFRAARALSWDRERILEETGWSHKKLSAVERYVQEEDLRLHREVNPTLVFTEYKDQQLQACRELEDLAVIFRDSKQFTSLVAAVKARSEILDKVIKTGQELGIIKRQAKQVDFNAKVDVRLMSSNQLRVHLEAKVAEIAAMINPPNTPTGTAGIVLDHLLPGKKKDPPEEVPAAGRRVKRLAS